MYETRFQALPGDVITIVSDGVIYAGVGESLNFGWTWEHVVKWLLNATALDMSAPSWPPRSPIRSMTSI